MRHRYLKSTLMLACLASWTPWALAQFPPTDCTGADTTFQVAEGAWQRNASWNFGSPGPGDIACIPDGRTAQIVPKVCIGGTENGNSACDPALNCFQGGVCTAGTCVDGPRNGSPCHCDGGICTFVVGGVCQGGADDGQVCDPNTGCMTGTCHPLLGQCVGGDRNNLPCECPGGTCIPDSPKGEAGAVWILGDPEGDRQDTRINVQGTLTLNGATSDSWVQYCTLYMNFNTRMVIANHLTISGEGAVMEGEYQFTSPPNVPASIEGLRVCIGGADAGQPCQVPADCSSGVCDPVTRCLGGTNHGADCDTDADCGEPPDDGSCLPLTLTLHGDNDTSSATSLLLDESWTLDVRLVNEAYIVSNHKSGIYLTGEAKSGSGYWIADDSKGESAGLLVIDAEITLDDPLSWRIGPAGDQTTKWRLADGATMRIDPNATFPNFTGNLDLAVNGTLETLEIRQNFTIPGDFLISNGKIVLEKNGQNSSTLTTQGDLLKTGGTITVNPGNIAYFGVNP